MPDYGQMSYNQSTGEGYPVGPDYEHLPGYGPNPPISSGASMVSTAGPPAPSDYAPTVANLDPPQAPEQLSSSMPANMQQGPAMGAPPAPVRMGRPAPPETTEEMRAYSEANAPPAPPSAQDVLNAAVAGGPAAAERYKQQFPGLATAIDVQMDKVGKTWVGPTAGRAAVEEHYTPQARVGAFELSPLDKIRGQVAYDNQADAIRGQTDAELTASHAQGDALAHRQAMLEAQQRDQYMRQAAIHDQVDKDRAEYETLKNEHLKDLRDGDSVLGTPVGMLSTIMGGLAIAMASRGHAENLQFVTQTVQGGIDRMVKQMQAQTAAKGAAADNAYNRFLRSYGNQQQAEAATKALIYDRAANDAERMANKANDPQIRARGDALLSDLDARRDQSLRDLAIASQGKVQEQFIQAQRAQAATRGHYRDQTVQEFYAGQKRDQELAKGEAGIAKDLASAQKDQADASGQDSEAKILKENQQPIERLTEVRNAKAKLLKFKDELRTAQDNNEWYGGMSPYDLPPALANKVAPVLQGGIGKKNRQVERLNEFADMKTKAISGVLTKDEKEGGRAGYTGGSTIQGTVDQVDRDLAALDDKEREIQAQMTGKAEGVYENRRAQTGAAQTTVPEPGVSKGR